MQLDLGKLTERLTDLDKKAEEFDKLLTDLRTEINDLLWDLIELKRGKEKKA